MSTLTAPTPAPRPLRQDAKIIGLVGLGHGVSHFSQLLLAPLFPWLKDAFAVSYTELGFLLTIFFVVSCVVQTLSGFWVDRYGPRPILFAGLLLLGVAALGYAASTGYWMLATFSVVAGIGNGVFHPVNYTLINRRVSKSRLGHAYSVHGVTGSLGWALAPAMLVPLTLAYSWRVALACAASLAFVVLVVLWIKRDELVLPPLPAAAKSSAAAEGSVDFLRIPAVWMCFGFFFFYAGSLSIVQTFGPEAARQLHAVPTHLVALCVTVYMLFSAGGMLLGGFLVADAQRCERIVGTAFALAATLALMVALAPMPPLAVPVIFAATGLLAGIAGPSRDLLVKQASPDNATGRVYGVVYSGLDIGQALVPLAIGRLMDHQAWSAVWLSLAALQAVLIVSALNVRRVRRTQMAPA